MSLRLSIEPFLSSYHLAVETAKSLQSEGAKFMDTFTSGKNGYFSSYPNFCCDWTSASNIAPLWLVDCYALTSFPFWPINCRDTQQFTVHMTLFRRLLTALAGINNQMSPISVFSIQPYGCYGSECIAVKSHKTKSEDILNYKLRNVATPLRIYIPRVGGLM